MEKSSDEVIADHISKTKFSDIPSDVVEVTKRSLLDSIGVMLAATTLGEGCAAFSDLAKEMGGNPQSTTFRGGHKVPAAMAAFANGALSHAMDFENVHDEATGHPDAASIPAALAMAEMLGSSGEELLTALTLASDLYSRMSLASNAHSRIWFDAAIMGAYSSPAAAGKLLKLSSKQLLDAVSLGFMQSTCSWELFENRRSNARAIREAFTAKAGVVGALLANKGVAGFDRPFTGTRGYFELYAGGKYTEERFVRNLGVRYEGAQVSFKPYPACRGTHAFVDAALELATTYGIKPAEIESMKAIGPEYFKFLIETTEPGTPMDARFSHRYTVSFAIHNRELKLNSFSKDALASPSIIELGKKLSYEVDESIPHTNASCGALEIKLKSGKVLKRDMKTATGHPDNPITADKLIAKFKDCASYAQEKMPDSRLDQIIEDVMSLEKQKDVRNFMKHLQQ